MYISAQHCASTSRSCSRSRCGCSTAAIGRGCHPPLLQQPCSHLSHFAGLVKEQGGAHIHFTSINAICAITTLTPDACLACWGCAARPWRSTESCSWDAACCRRPGTSATTGAALPPDSRGLTIGQGRAGAGAAWFLTNKTFDQVKQTTARLQFAPSSYPAATLHRLLRHNCQGICTKFQAGRRSSQQVDHAMPFSLWVATRAHGMMQEFSRPST